MLGIPICRDAMGDGSIQKRAAQAAELLGRCTGLICVNSKFEPI